MCHGMIIIHMQFKNNDMTVLLHTHIKTYAKINVQLLGTLYVL